MQLTLPDCCLAEFCPGIHVEGHNMREDVSLRAQGPRVVEVCVLTSRSRVRIIRGTTPTQMHIITTIRASHYWQNKLIVLTHK